MKTLITIAEYFVLCSWLGGILCLMFANEVSNYLEDRRLDKEFKDVE